MAHMLILLTIQTASKIPPEDIIYFDMECYYYPSDIKLARLWNLGYEKALPPKKTTTELQQPLRSSSKHNPQTTTMSTPRLTTTLIFRASRSSIPLSVRQFRGNRPLLAAALQRGGVPSWATKSQLRFYSQAGEGGGGSKIYAFEDVS